MSRPAKSAPRTRSAARIPAALASRPITTELNATHYEWAGTTLQRLLGASQPIAETWAFFSGPQKPSRLSGPEAAGLTMQDLVVGLPQALGPDGADPENGGQKYFFVKLLDPSDFPRFAYVGLRPEAAEALGGTPARLRERFAELLWQDREALEAFAALVRPRVGSRRAFEALKAAYKGWAIEQAAADWAGPTTLDVGPFAEGPSAQQAQEALARQQQIRRQLVGLMHRIDFEPDQAILIETPTLHAIAGLSLQIHPKAPGNFFPKDELWIYEEVTLPGGASSWLLVEPQRTFDKTEAGADFFTPFAWEATAERGTLGFRKPITKAYLETFVSLMDATPRPREHFLRKAEPLPQAAATGGAQWARVVEEPGWPYFSVRRLRFSRAGETTVALPHHSFTELHAASGTVEALLEGETASSATVTVTPEQPVLLPASLPHERVTYRSAGPACLYLFTR
jgi:hypothetical protein